MKILLKANKTVEFLDEQATEDNGYINANDVLVEQLIVRLANPLLNTETLWVVFATEEETKSGTALTTYTHDIWLQPLANGDYATTIPTAITKKSGRWFAQLLRRKRNTADGTVFATQTASNVFSFIVEEGLPYGEDDEPLNVATVVNLYEFVQASVEGIAENVSRAEGYKNETKQYRDEAEYNAQNPLSAYGVAVKNGFEGTELEWLDSLHGGTGSISGIYARIDETGNRLEMEIDDEYVITLKLKDKNGNQLGETQVIDLPLESVVVGGRYDATSQKIVLTLDNGNEVDIPVGALVNGLANANGTYPNMTVGNATNATKATNDGTGRNIADTANKALYNLGAFDTIIAEDETSVTVRRQTGKQNLDNANVIYRSNARTFNIAIDDIKRATDNNIIPPIKTPNYNATSWNADWTEYNMGMAKTYPDEVAFYLPSANTDIPTFRLSVLGTVLVYQTATYYDERIIKNVPLHSADQNQELWAKEEWQKGLNLFDIAKAQRGKYAYYLNGDINNGGNDNLLSDFIDVSNINTLYHNSGFNCHICFYDANKNYVSGALSDGLIIVPSNAKFMRATLSDYYLETGKCMLVEGNHAYPYQPYNGVIVHEKDVPIHFSTSNVAPEGNWTALGSFTIGSTTVYAWKRG